MALSGGAVIARIVSQYSDKGSKAAQKDIAKMGKKIDSWANRTVKAYAVAGAAAVAFAYKIGKTSVNAAIEDAKSASVLANTLKNVTNATNEQITAVEEYISKQQMLANISDTELRSSLNTLVTATKDVTQAQYLNNIAIDAAVGSNKDLGTVSGALAKAATGNYTALKKLFPALDATAVKTKDFGKILDQLTSTYQGAAKAAADKDPFTRLKLEFGEVAEAIGYVLMPEMIKFATYLTTTIIPKVKEWVDLNSQNLTKSFDTTIYLLGSLVNGMVQILAVIEKYKTLILIVAGIPWLIKIYGQVVLLLGIFKQFTTVVNALFSMKTISTIGLMATRFNTFAMVVGGTGWINGLKFLVGLATKLNPTLRALGILAGLAVGIKGMVMFLENIGGRAENALNKTARAHITVRSATETAALAGFKSIEVAVEQAKAQEEARKELLKTAAAQAAAAKAAEKDAKAKALRAAIQKKIESKFGIKFSPTGDAYGAIQDEAVKKNLERSKEGAAYLASMNKLTQLNNDLNKEGIIILQRYSDIVANLDKLRQNDLVVLGYLAKKWDMTTEAADAYIKSVLAVGDNKIDDYEVILLAKSWGSTYDQAKKYLDFFQAINDGVLTDAEIAKLQNAWGMTQKEVLLYADFVRVVNDGKLTDEEIKKLQDRWGLTVEEISDYILKLGSPVAYNGTLVDPAIFAKNAWLDAIAALERYIKMLGGVPGGVPGGKGFIPGSGEDPAVIADAAKAAAAAADAAAAAAAALAESEEALAAANAAASAQAASEYAFAKLVGDTDAMALAAAKVNPSALAKGESGAIGAASIAAQLAAAEKQLAFDRSMATYASFQAKERADAAAAVVSSSMSDAAADAAERARFRAMINSNTISTAKDLSGGGNLMAGGSVSVTVNVAGSVTTEQDLVQTVRNGLLGTQYNGNQINLQAV
jgi:hypothetical protein